jgi:hypothetical protein
MTIRFSASLARPVMERRIPAVFFEDICEDVPVGGGPMSKVFRFNPDCIFHIVIEPIDDPTIEKFPHAETHTACIASHKGERAVIRNELTVPLHCRLIPWI